MHKKLEAELVSLAHSILEMENKADVKALQKKARLIYEKLSVLKFIEKSFIEEPDTINEKLVDELKMKEITEDQVEKTFSTQEISIKDDTTQIPSLQNSLKEELKDAISADVATQLFERVTKENPVIEDINENSQQSLNDTLFKNNLQIGLNDRIAFVKHLFEGNQGDFNRVLSQLNSFKTEKEAKDFIVNMVKPDYDWNEKVEYEERLITIIERKFL
ncbi:hypothetical protein Lupro_09690 [Lutibacter profundi]|uniref:Uncharacterized protein n=1 Tax=Lutibacter profundi TaxID=1622118 RepID=A0A0X8G7I8_9FLAO|nr:hypothetical protein [Lutibacter profundi]AMC11521.1 hypothetical protein Lupro_09690 [Lutibacter profundi]